MSPAALPRSVLVTGLVRNCARGIATELQRLQGVLQGFEKVQWLLVESDSHDDSLKVLEALSARMPGFRHVSLGALRGQRPLRTDRLAHCRNAYLEEIDHNPVYAGVQTVLVTDWDRVNTHLTSQGLRSCWARDGWDACMPNQAGPYYDVWALRHPEWSANDCFAAMRFLQRQGLTPERALREAVDSRMITISPQADWIEVDSAFGGMAVYRREALRGLRYQGLDAAGHETCEHVALHAQMRARGSRLFINPQFINAGWTEHTQRLRLHRSLTEVASRPLRWVYAKVQAR